MGDSVQEKRDVELGELHLGAPIMLAPMAGVTNPPFRQLCREFGDSGLAAAGGEPLAHRSDGTRTRTGLYTCEMITARALVAQNPETLNMVRPDMGDPVRSVQLYGVEPGTVGAAVSYLVERELADHVDLNFGCPVPKVTRKGGGSALPWKHDLFEEVVRAAVRQAEQSSRKAHRAHVVPVTAKIRSGIDAGHETYRDVAKIAQNAGIAGLTLHARTTAQHYSGQAHWDDIRILKEQVTVPVFGNGDIFEVDDARRVMEQTGCDGVVIGRGCQGRPWIFFDFVADYFGSERRSRPNLEQVAQVIMRHAGLSVEHFADEPRALREMRKHMAWYLRGFAVGGELRHALALVSTLEELRSLLDTLDLSQEYPAAAEGPRGRAGGEKRPHLPDHWLDSHELTVEQRNKISEAEIGISGG